MKKIIIYLVLFGLICCSSDFVLKYSIGKEIDNQSPYYLSFASIGANLLESRLDCWAKIKTISTNEEMEQYLLKVLTQLDIPADPSDFLHQESKEILLIQYNLCNNNKNYYFMLQTNKLVNTSHLLMTVTDTKNDVQLKSDEKKLREILDCTAYYQYKGLIDARPDDNGQDELMHIVFKNLKAEINDVYDDGKIISMTGYSPIMGQNIVSVNLNNQPCNVQAAMRRSTHENKTEIYLGFPLLLNDY